MSDQEKLLAERCGALTEKGLKPGYYFKIEVVGPQEREVIRLVKLVKTGDRENVFKSGVRENIVGSHFI